MHSELLIIALVAIGAYFMPILSKRFNMPSAVAEFFFGMLIGTFIIKDFDIGSVHFMSEIGFIMLMYIAGLELDIDWILSLKHKEVISYFGYVFILIVASILLTYVFNLPKYYILVLMTSAIGLLFAVLNEIGMLKSKIGQILILIGILGEVFTLAGITIVSIVAKSKSFEAAIINIGMIFLFLFFAFIILKLLKRFIWWHPEAKKLFLSVGSASEIGVRANFLNMLVFAVLAELVHLEPILGAFMGGAVFSRLFADREHMLERLSSFGYGFFIPLFFIGVGTRFNLNDFAIFEVFKNALILSGLILIARIIAVIPLIIIDIPKRYLLYVPFSQAFPLTLLVAVAAVGLNIKIIDNSQASVIVLTAIITAILFPWVIKLINKFIPVT